MRELCGCGSGPDKMQKALSVLPSTGLNQEYVAVFFSENKSFLFHRSPTVQKMEIFTGAIPQNSEYLLCYTDLKINLLVETELFGMFQFILSQIVLFG